jgi:enoyl-CoA hydratase/carnithine racemase
VTELNGAVAIITLNRPEKRNALSLDLMRELICELTRIDRKAAVQVVILAAQGPVFCSGHDLSEMTGRTDCEYRELFDTCTELMLKLQGIPQPVIAEVQGMATAAGCQLVATCDLAIASEAAAFATPGVRIGLFCSTPMVALTRAVGRKRAMQMLLTGEKIDAQTAAEWGLVNSVVKPEDLRDASLALATRIAEASAAVVGIGKQAFYAQIDLPVGEAYKLTKEVMTGNAQVGDAQEGISAFLGKRVPKWSGGQAV